MLKLKLPLFFSNIDKYDRLLKDEADLQSLVDITQELFPIEILGKVLISFIEVPFFVIFYPVSSSFVSWNSIFVDSGGFVGKNLSDFDFF